MEVANSSIPVDVLYNIFLRLLAKSLLRFRCVSKFWCNTFPISLPEITPTAWHSFACDGNLIKRSEYPTYIDKDYVVCQVGYGLLCFRHKYGGGDTLLCNPLRREVLKLPTVRTGIYSGQWYGIGFDSINNTFKIVRVLSFSKSLVTEFHTLGTESWWHISSIPSCNSLSAIGVSACGDMHWTSFNFQKEEFKLMMLQYRKDFMLVNVKGFLAVVNFPQPTDIEIWVLKDYDKNVWMKEYRLTTKIYVNRVSSVSACCDGIFFHCDQIKGVTFSSPKKESHFENNLLG
ncbi:hypothetical protein LWI29_015280 [Acer saccharum]|uniref:F-box domain-containing protein n=1 Tax=Acer saccharum TaxID=4024 RepID=A0AA39RWI2_ACESA|nr:hypothetical protein LWI29_015280 [Acer saccharum]